MFNIYEHHKVKVLTKRQSEVYNFVVKYVEKNRIAPTYDEIRDGCDLGSIANSYRIIKDLITKKLVHKIGKTQQPRQVYPIIDEKYIRD
jgi:SOS-response transcriptional repressor LexA